jgi:hypothetical protein
MMARKNSAQMLLDVMDELRMRTLAPDVRMLWLDIARMMQRDRISVLRFGSEIVGAHRLAILVSRPETESETELETKITELCERGLLAREADGAISCPMLAQALTRAEINRENGRKGGRPRKDGAPPGQRSMPFVGVIGGTDMETKKTETETQARDNGISSTTTTSISKSVSESEFTEVGEMELDAIGIDRAKSFIHYGQVRQWLKDGATRELILDVVRGVMARPGMTAERIRSLNFFNAAIAEAIAKKPAPKPLWEKKWEDDYRIWELTRKGECPRSADYRAKYAA